MLVCFVIVLILLLERSERSEEDNMLNIVSQHEQVLQGAEGIELREQEYYLAQACGVFVLLQKPLCEICTN